MKKIQVTEDVADILRRSAITETSLTLPNQLSRPDYVKVMKVIESAGGKWNKEQKCHAFADDPRQTFSEALQNAEIADRSERAVRTEKQAFYTPPAVADMLIEHADVQEHHSVLEPSAGMGGIASRLWNEKGKCKTRHRLLMVENDSVAYEFLCKKYNPDSIVMLDFLAMVPPDLKISMFDRVLMNPPFTKGQDIDHITHAFKFLKSGGWLLAIMLPSFQTKQDKRSREFSQLMNEHGEILETLNNGEFRESGTMVNTIIIKLIKP